MSKYSKLTSFLESQDPIISGVFENLCLENLLVLKKQLGITLLVPTNKAFREKLVTLSESENPDDVETATHMISALVLNNVYRTPGDIMSKRDDIANALGQRLEIEGATGSYINTKNGKITPDADFIDASKKQKYAVWKFDGADININAPKTTGKYKDLPAQTPNKETENIRRQIASSVENSYVSEQIGKELRPDSNPFLDATMSLVQFLISNEYCKEVLMNRVIPLISFDKMDFYLLVEPYKETGPYLIDDRIIADWYSSKTIGGAKTNNVIDSILTMKRDGANREGSNREETRTETRKEPLMYSNQQSSLNLINEARERILTSRTAPQNLNSVIFKVYDDLLASGILPKSLVEWYGTGANKAYEDEFRFIMFQLFSDLERGSFERKRFERIVDDIMRSTAGVSIKPFLLRKLNTGLPPTEKIAEIKSFINSTMFFHIPLSTETLGKYPHDSVLSKPSPNHSEIFNIAEILKRRRAKYFSAEKTTDMKAELQRLKKEGKLDEYLKSLE